MSLHDWLLFLHVLAAFAIVGAEVLFTFLIVWLWRTDMPADIARVSGLSKIGSVLIGVGAMGTLILGIVLAFEADKYAIWDIWIIAALVLWAIAGGIGGRTGKAYMEGMTKAQELERAGQTGPNAELLALNRTQQGLLLHTAGSIAVLLLLIDMIWKPGA